MGVLTEEKIYEAFGLEKPEAEVEEPAQQDQQKPAAPDQESTAEQGAETEVGTETASDADSENDNADTEVQPESNTDTGADAEKLTPEQRRQNAARRREAQQKAAIDAAVEAALQAERQKQDAERQTLITSLGLKDDDGQPITTPEQLQKWQQGHSARRLEQDLKQGKLTPEALQEAIGNHPAVRQAQAMVEQAQQQAKAQQETADQQRIEADMEKIRARDPSVKEVKDLLTMPESDAFREYVRKGHSFDEAHYLATRERREKEVAEAARQKALNDARSKDHLKGTGNARGSGAVTVPGEVMALYRRLNPKASEAEIVAHYNQYKKK